MKKHGWTLYSHPAFEDVFDGLTAKVKKLKAEHPDTYEQNDHYKLFQRIYDLITDEIPLNPADPKYKQGNTLGTANRHWYRAKFFQRYRLFFRFHSEKKAIVYAWANDEKTLRKAGSKSDPYAQFKKRLEQANPPSDWDDLFEASSPLD
jgi:toxin YhaV